MKSKGFKSNLHKVWDFLWHDDSWKSWTINIIIAFILVKFVIYPGLGALFGTSLPVVAVVSGSMDHDGSFDDWWVDHEDFYLERLITKQQFQLYPLKNGFSKGDVIVLTGTDTENIDTGEVIVFSAAKQYPIIHRVVDNNDDGTYVTKGDANKYPGVDGEINEYAVSPNQVLGKAQFKIPWIGWLKIAFTCGIDSIRYGSGVPGGSFGGCITYQS
jgi:signal peptidase I